MIRWAETMYFDRNVKKRSKRIMWAVSSGRFLPQSILPGLYCITLSSNPNNLLDIMNVHEFKFSYYRKQELYVLGLAMGKESALELVREIIDEVYQNTGDVKIREYYQDRWETC